MEKEVPDIVRSLQEDERFEHQAQDAEEYNRLLAIPEDELSDELYDQAVALVTRERKASTSFVQRYLQIGYNRAARLIERMEAEGVVSTANHVGKREVLVRRTNDDDD